MGVQNILLGCGDNSFDVTSTVSSDSSSTLASLTSYINSLGWDGTKKLKGTITISAGMYSTAGAAVYAQKSDYPDDSDFTLHITSSGYIIGKGGDGGNVSGDPAGNGGNGTPGLLVATTGSCTLRVINDGYIAGGGGGGGASRITSGPPSPIHGAGHGGAGRDAGQGGSASGAGTNYQGNDGTLTEGGCCNGPGGAGGDRGEDGQGGQGGQDDGSGGTAGAAINGYSGVTYSGSGTLYGDTTG